MDKKSNNKEESEEYEDEEEEEEEDDEEEDKKKEIKKKDEKKEETKKDEIKKEEGKKEEIKKVEDKKDETKKEEIKKEETKKDETKKEEEKEEEEEEEEEKEEEKKEEKKDNNEQKQEKDIKIEHKIEERKEEINDNQKDEIKEEIKDEKKSSNEINTQQNREESKNDNELNNDNNESNSDLKSNKATRPPTITKFHITKSSSASNIFTPSLNNNIQKNKTKDELLTTLDAKEIRFKDIFESSKRYFQKQFNLQNQRGCFKCNITDLSEEKYITFSCGHKICEECLIKDLLLLQFKIMENKDHIQFNCICLIGTSPQYQYNEFIERIKKINELKQQKHQCAKHLNEAIKYCKDCELWLCDECISIHDVFNKNHILSNKGVPLKIKCKQHNNEFTQFYCLKCNEEICPFCLTKLGKHLDHKNIKFENFEKLAEEIISKLKFKNYEDCIKNFESIREKNINEKNQKIESFKEKIENLIRKIKTMEDNYIKEINDKVEYLNYVIDVMKECYKYFYIMLSKEKKEYKDLTFLRDIAEISTIKSFYSNYDDITYAYNFIDKFDLNNKFYYSYEIKIDATPFQFSPKFEKIFYKKFKINQSNEEQKKGIRIKSKYNIQNITYQEIKYDKNINTKKGNIYSICKTNQDEIAVACGNEIYIISNISSETHASLDKYPSLISHTKNIICMCVLQDNKLVSGAEDRFIKIWDISKKKLISSISKNYKRIDSLLPYKNNYIIVGAYSTIKIININTKDEIITLMGHEKSICCLIEIYPDILASGSYDNTIKIWDLKNKICEYTLYGHDSPVFCILMLKDGRLISGSGSKNKSLKIWNLDKKICEFSLIGHKREVRDIKQLRNGLVATASMDKTIKIWNIHKRICVQTLISHNDVVFSLCIIDKNRFVSGGRDEDIIIWKY